MIKNTVKIVILDRDGVINWDSSDYVNSIDRRITSAEEWQPLAGSLEAITKLTKTGFKVCVATNQSIVAKGIISIDTLDSIHAKMQQLLKLQGGVIEQVFVCPHKESDNCLCRKPKPGMLLDIAKKYSIDFSKQLVPFVGDSEIDLLAATACGCIPVLVKTGKGLETLHKVSRAQIPNLLVFADLPAFVEYWVNMHAT